jgi:hypothetical protein
MRLLSAWLSWYSLALLALFAGHAAASSQSWRAAKKEEVSEVRSSLCLYFNIFR